MYDSIYNSYIKKKFGKQIYVMEIKIVVLSVLEIRCGH
jgi:hypothetical protein